MITETEYRKIKPYKTKDGSLVRELMHPSIHGNFQQSLAEAIISAGSITLFHKHMRTEEIYHITEGNGTMNLGNEQFEVIAGDTICILPGTPHRIKILERAS